MKCKHYKIGDIILCRGIFCRIINSKISNKEIFYSVETLDEGAELMVNHSEIEGYA